MSQTDIKDSFFLRHLNIIFLLLLDSRLLLRLDSLLITFTTNVVADLRVGYLIVTNSRILDRELDFRG